MADKMRVSSRISRKDAAPARHNSRTKFKEQAAHIDENKSKSNWYWTDLTGAIQEVDLKKIEEEYYNKHFSLLLEDQNAKYRERRQHKNVKTMKQFMSSPRYKPEEQILQVGDMHNTISKEELLSIYQDFVDWHTKEFKEVKFIDAALHDDETGAPHFHIRRVWVIEDDNGVAKKICQADVLDNHNIKRPDLTKPQSKKNNPKMTYTKIIREKLLEICIAHGFDIAVDVKDPDAVHLHPDEFKKKKELEEKIKILEAANDKLEKKNIELNAKLEEKNVELKKKDMELNAKDIELDRLQRECDSAKRYMEQLSSDVMNLHKVMLDPDALVSLKTDQAQLVYNEIKDVRDRFKREKLMTDEYHKVFEDYRKYVNTANDYLQGYSKGSYSDDPVVNRFMIEHRIDFEAFKAKDKADMDKLLKEVDSYDRELKQSWGEKYGYQSDDYGL